MNKKYRKITWKAQLVVLIMTCALVAGCGTTPAKVPEPTATQMVVPTVSPTETPVPPTATPEPTAAPEATDTSNPESETISTGPVVEEESQAEILRQQLRENFLLPQLTATFIFPVETGEAVENNPLFEAAMTEALAQSVPDSETRSINEIDRRELMERTLAALYRGIDMQLQEMVRKPEGHETDPHYAAYELSTALRLGDGAGGVKVVPLTSHRPMPIEDKTIVANYVPVAQSVWNDEDVQVSVSDQFAKIAEVGKPENFGVLPGAVIINEDGTLTRTRDLSDENKVNLSWVYPDEIEAYQFYETQSALVAMMRTVGVSYYGDTESPGSFWFMRQEGDKSIMVLVRVQSGGGVGTEITAEEYSSISFINALQGMYLARTAKPYDLFRPDRIDHGIRDMTDSCVNMRIIDEYAKTLP